MRSIFKNFLIPTKKEYKSKNEVYAYELHHVSVRNKELTFSHKLKFYNPYIFAAWWCTLLIYDTETIWFNRIHSLKYQRPATLGCRDIGIAKIKFSTRRTQFNLIWNFKPNFVFNFRKFYTWFITAMKSCTLQTNLQEEKVKFHWHYCYDFVTPFLL